MFDVFINTAGHSLVYFEKGRVRAAMRAAGRDVQKEARRLVARRAISAAGENPGRQTGALMRAIKPRVSKSGFMVKVMPDKTADMRAYYPAFLYYGVPGRLAKRNNYMAEALDNRRSSVQALLAAAMDGALQPKAGA
jgi:hypothetical protein